MGVHTAFYYVDCADILNVVAHGYAAAAENALGIIPDNGGGYIVDFRFGFGSVKGKLTDTVFVTKLLKLAVAVAYAAGAFTIVVGKQQLKIYFSRLADFGGVGFYVHSFGYRENAGSLKATSAAFNQA
jgi:hypothetical protein